MKRSEMTFETLREFVVIAECGRFDKAAEQLFIAPSSLSKHIKKAESDLGVRLFERSSRGLCLTEAGQILLPYARNILAMEEEYTDKLRVFSEDTEFTLNIGSIPYMSAYHISDLLVRFRREQPHIQQNISCVYASLIRQKLLEGEFELAFMRRAPWDDDSDITVIPYTEDRLVAICSAGHPLANRGSVSLSELAKEPIIGYHPQTFMGRFVCSACDDAGFIPSFVMISNQFDNQIEMASHDIGIALLMKKAARSASDSRIVMLDIDPPYLCRIDLCYVSGHHLSLAAQRFVNLVREQPQE